MPLGVPCQLNTLHPKIRNHLISRYLSGIWLCYLTEYKVLALFLLYLRFDIGHPIDCIMDILSWMLFAVCTLKRMPLLGVHVASYGLLLWHMHEQRPSWPRLQRELPQKLCLLAILSSFGYTTSWLYLSYVDKLTSDLDVAYTGHYLQVYGAFSGIVYFLAEHLNFGCEIWPLPVARIEFAKAHLLRWSCWDFFVPCSVCFTFVLAALYRPNMGGDQFASWQLIRLCGVLTTLIIAKMNAIKRIFGLVMHCQLPLTFELDQSGLPMSLALRGDCQLYGFQLQAARDFYESIVDSCDEQSALFQLQGIVRKLPKNWQALRDVLLHRIGQFTKRLSHCLKPTGVEVCPKQSDNRGPSKLRPLMLPASPQRFWSRRCGEFQPPCRILRESRLLRCVQDINRMLNVAPGAAEPSPLEEELDCGSSIVWLIQGLVCICVRSLDEDNFGFIQQDLEQIFRALVDLHRLLRTELKLNQEQDQEPSENLEILSLAVQRSLNQLLHYFHSYLHNVVQDQQLLQLLRDLHMKSLS